MKITIKMKGARCRGVVILELSKGDKRPRSESHLMYMLKCALAESGKAGTRDLIKKLMWKDGHLVADTQHYIRSRHGTVMIWDSDYSIRDSVKDLAKDGSVKFMIVRDGKL